MTPKEEVEKTISEFKLFMEKQHSKFKSDLYKIEKNESEKMRIASEINFLIIELKSEVYNYLKNLNLNPISDFFAIFGQVYGNVDNYKGFNIQIVLTKFAKEFNETKRDFENKTFDSDENYYSLPIHF
jgi:hypothetical protein